MEHFLQNNSVKYKITLVNNTRDNIEYNFQSITNLDGEICPNNEDIIHFFLPKQLLRNTFFFYIHDTKHILSLIQHENMSFILSKNKDITIDAKISNNIKIFIHN